MSRMNVKPNERCVRCEVMKTAVVWDVELTARDRKVTLSSQALSAVTPDLLLGNYSMSLMDGCP